MEDNLKDVLMEALHRFQGATRFSKGPAVGSDMQRCTFQQTPQTPEHCPFKCPLVYTVSRRGDNLHPGKGRCVLYILGGKSSV